MTSEFNAQYMDQRLTFGGPYGPATVPELQAQIRADGLVESHFGHAVSLALAARQNRRGKAFAPVNRVLKRSWSTAIDTAWNYIPNPQGVYVVPSVAALVGQVDEDTQVELTGESLSQLIDAGYKGVAFVDAGYPTGEMSPLELGRHPLMKASLPNGTAQSVELAKTYGDKSINKPSLWALDAVNSETLRYVSVESGRAGARLYVDGSIHPSNWNCHSFGVAQSKS